jgi:hypothetical protein
VILATKTLLIATVATGLVLGGGLMWQTKRLADVRAEFSEYRGGVEALGRQAEARARAQIESDRKIKELTDAENAAAVANLTATVGRLRKQLAGGGGLSAAAPAAGGPDAACYDRAEFAGALRRLDEGFLGIAAEGAAAVADLNSAKRWAAQ